MPTKIMDFDETDNPFRPEGDLAKEAEVFVHELKVKAEKEVNDIIHQTCAVSPNTSLLNAPSVNEIIHHEDNGDETDNHNHNHNHNNNSNNNNNSNKSRTGQSESVVVGAVVTGDNINFSSSSNNNNNNSNSSNNNNNNNSNSNNSNSNNNNSKSNEASRLVDGEAPASQPEKVGKASKKSKKSKDGKPKCGCILS